MFTLSNYSGNRSSIQKIIKVLNESIDHLVLIVAQAAAMEISDRNSVQGHSKLPNTSVPLNDGTNDARFLRML